MKKFYIYFLVSFFTYTSSYAQDEATAVPDTLQDLVAVPDSLENVTPDSLQDATTVSDSLQDATAVPDSLQDATTVSDSLQDATAVPDSLQDATAVPDSLKDWIIGGRVGLNFSNVSLTNWAGGGQESVSGTGNFLITANYKKKKFKWKNSLEVAYGLIKQGDVAVIKSDDKILLTSELDYNFKPKWSFSNVFTFRSQFAPGYNPPEIQVDSTKISDWLAPGYIQEALGFGYQPTEYFSLFISPLTAKITLVMDQRLANRGDYGVEAAVRDTAGNIITEGENIRAEIGASFRFNFKKEVIKNVEYESVLDLFSNYLENPDAIDVNWINNLNMKINDFMTASVLTQLIYDQDIKIAAEDDPTDVAPRTQFKSVLGIGITYKF